MIFTTAGFVYLYPSWVLTELLWTPFWTPWKVGCTYNAGMWRELTALKTKSTWQGTHSTHFKSLQPALWNMKTLLDHAEKKHLNNLGNRLKYFFFKCASHPSHCKPWECSLQYIWLFSFSFLLPLKGCWSHLFPCRSAVDVFVSLIALSDR